MIGRLRGELLEVTGTLLTVDVGGVGYEVTVSEEFSLRLPAEGEPIELFIRQIIREDSNTLYGFGHSSDRRMFDLLLRVNGCGPRVALAVLSAVGTEETVRAILTGDAKRLTAASGVGKRLAERIVLELQTAIEGEAGQLKGSGTATPIAASADSDDDLIAALQELGYRPAEAERLAKAVPAGGTIAEKIIAATQLARK